MELAIRLQAALLGADKAAFLAALKESADPNLALPLPGQWGGQLGFSGKAPAVVIAAQVDDPWYLQALLDYQGNPNALAEGRNGSTLERALWSKTPTRASLLLRRGLSLTGVDNEGYTAMDTAIANRRYDFAIELSRRGAVLEQGSESGKFVKDHICMMTFLSDEVAAERRAFIEELRLRGVVLDCSKSPKVKTQGSKR